MVGVVALPISLRRSDISSAERALPTNANPGIPGRQVQVDFRDFFEKVKQASGPKDWLEWTTQYRNMFVHRGRRITYNQIHPRETPLYDERGQWIPRATSTMHLARCPDKSHAEAMISKDMILNEDADITLHGVFESCRDLEEHVCERLVSIWRERRNNPALLEQPPSQWDTRIRQCTFAGYDPSAERINADILMSNPILRHRLLAASLDDSHSKLWTNSKWNQ